MTTATCKTRVQSDLWRSDCDMKLELVKAYGFNPQSLFGAIANYLYCNAIQSTSDKILKIVKSLRNLPATTVPSCWLLSNTTSANEANQHNEFNIPWRSVYRHVRICVLLRRGGGAKVKDYPNGYVHFIKNGISVNHSDKHNFRVLRSLCPEILALQYQEEGDFIIPFTREGSILTREDAIELIAELQKFYDAVSDEEVEEFNSRPAVEPQLIPQKAEKKVVPGWVYLVKAEGLNHHKIGQSKAPKIRLKQLQQQSPVKLSLVHLIECKDMSASEERLHKRFRKYRVEGEWFELPQDAIEYICSLEVM